MMTSALQRIVLVSSLVLRGNRSFASVEAKTLAECVSDFTVSQVGCVLDAGVHQLNETITLSGSTIPDNLFLVGQTWQTATLCSWICIAYT